jgi:Ca2+-binding EF-hand superfamily protein
MSLGIIDDVDEVKKIMNLIDKDGNGSIEFDEFIGFIKESKKIEENVESFKNLIKYVSKDKLTNAHTPF